jgi:transposase-like protein
MKTRTPPQLKFQAIALLAEGRFNYAEIAGQIGIDVRTIARWRKDEKFASRVEELRAELDATCMQRALARKEYRIGQLAERHSKLRQVIESRAAAEIDTRDGAAGMDTGLVCKRPVVSAGELMGYEYEVDTGTLKELRAIEEAIAKELGQLVDKRELTGKEGGPLQVATPERMSDEQLKDEIRRILGVEIVEPETGETEARCSGKSPRNRA